jgi:NAD(P)H-flavin reductase
LSLTPQIVALRRALINYVNAKIEGQEADEQAIKTHTIEKSENLCFIVKRYNLPGALSRYMHDAKPLTYFHIEGPIVSGFDHG